MIKYVFKIELFLLCLFSNAYFCALLVFKQRLLELNKCLNCFRSRLEYAGRRVFA